MRARILGQININLVSVTEYIGTEPAVGVFPELATETAHTTSSVGKSGHA